MKGKKEMEIQTFCEDKNEEDTYLTPNQTCAHSNTFWDEN